MKAAVGVLNLSNQINTISIIRTAEHFGIRRVFVLGRTISSFKTSMNCNKYLIIKTFSTEQQFVEHIKKQGYRLVLIEKSRNSKNIFSYKFPDDIVLMTGHERNGFSKYLLENADGIVHIPNVGLVPCMNTAAAFSIGVYKYFEQKVLK